MRPVARIGSRGIDRADAGPTRGRTCTRNAARARAGPLAHDPTLLSGFPGTARCHCGFLERIAASSRGRSQAVGAAVSLPAHVLVLPAATWSPDRRFGLHVPAVAELAIAAAQPVLLHGAYQAAVLWCAEPPSRSALWRGAAVWQSSVSERWTIRSTCARTEASVSRPGGSCVAIGVRRSVAAVSLHHAGRFRGHSRAYDRCRYRPGNAGSRFRGADGGIAAWRNRHLLHAARSCGSPGGASAPGLDGSARLSRERAAQSARVGPRV